MEHRIFAVYLFLTCLEASTAFVWNSASTLPNGTTIPACPGQDVTLAWSYTADTAEHLTNVEWHYRAPGGVEAPVATQILGSFIAVPSSTLHVQFLPNAGIRLLNVVKENTGTYSVHVNLNNHGSVLTEVQTVELQVSDADLTSDGQLHAAMLPTAVYDNTTQQFHVQLSCGDVKTIWEPKTSVIWKTPSGQTVPSTSHNNGHFYLSLPNPVSSGQYTCAIDNTSAASLCVGSGSPLLRGATVKVDGNEARFVVMEARMSALQQENERLALGEENLKHVINANTNLINSKSTDLDSKLQRAVRQVFFHAYTPSGTSNNPIIFSSAYSNVGGGYSTSTGYFTAPVAGTYLFMFSILHSGSNSDDNTYADLMVEGVSRGQAFGEAYASGSNHAVEHLSVGDRVWIRGDVSHLNGGDATTFTGVLIQADL